MDLTYTTKILSVNVAEGTFQIKYIPNDEDLIPVTYNTYLFEKNYTEIRDENNNLVYNSQDDVPFSVHLNYTIERSAPTDLWRRHKILLNNISALQALM